MKSTLRPMVTVDMQKFTPLVNPWLPTLSGACATVQPAWVSAPGCQYPQHTLVLVYSDPNKAPLKLLDLVEQGCLQKGSHTGPRSLALLHKEHLQ